MDEKEELMEQTPDNSSPGASDISATIDKLLANPELINMVASAIGKSPINVAESKNESGSVSGQKELAVSKASQSAPDVISTIAPVLAALKGTGAESVKSDRRACLLGALKPYLCKERCDAIDYMIKLGRISELLKNMS